MIESFFLFADNQKKGIQSLKNDFHLLIVQNSKEVFNLKIKQIYNRKKKLSNYFITSNVASSAKSVQ